jgi:hypothetical protein
MEANMNRTFIATVTLLSLSSAALAHSARRNPVSRQEIARVAEASMSRDPASATLVPLIAIAPAANRHAAWARYYADEQSQWRPGGATPNIAPYGVANNGAVYLNGWSSSNNPGDCNRGCVNSNGG